MHTLQQLASYLKDWPSLQRLATDRIPEQRHLDYKSSAYARSDGQKRELRRDATSIANGGGGYLVLGIDEQNDIAVAVPGIPNPTQEEMSIRDTLTSCIDPPFDPGGFSVATKPGPGGGVIVVTIPRAQTSHPHGVAESSRPVEFWMRRDRKKSYMTHGEIRAAFLVDPTVDRTRRSLERVDQAFHALHLQPMPPDRSHDVFRLRDIGEHEITLVKESNDTPLKIPLAIIQSLTESGGPSIWTIALKPPNRIVWDHPRWKVSLG